MWGEVSDTRLQPWLFDHNSLDWRHPGMFTAPNVYQLDMPLTCIGDLLQQDKTATSISESTRIRMEGERGKPVTSKLVISG